MSSAVISLESLYAPIVDELRAVRELFDEELHCDLPFIEDLGRHLRRYQGKMMRPALTLLCGQACGALRREHIVLSAVLEMIHVATLVHGDVLDEADLRRQSPTLNAMSSNETAVLFGDHLISHAYHLCSSLDSQEAARVVARCTNTVCEGELLQVYNRNNWALSQDEYLEIISRKTAALTGVACMLGARFADADASIVDALTCYGTHAGIAFQVVDDILDVVGQECEVGKTLGRDLQEGKLTLPVIHYLELASRTQRQRLMELCSDQACDRRPAIRDLLNGSIEYAIGFARQQVDSALNQLFNLEASPARDSLAAMAHFIVDRRF